MKIILTETQVLKIQEQLLLERPKKKKNPRKGGEERSMKERFLEDVKSEAAQILKQGKIGDEVVVVTGESTPDGDLDFNHCEFKSFAILEINGDVLTLELMLGEGISKVEANKHYFLNMFNSIFFNKGNPYIKLGVGTKGNIKNIKLNDFIMVSIYDAFDKNDEFITHGIQRLEAEEAIKNEEFDKLSKEEAENARIEAEKMKKQFMDEKSKLTPKVTKSIDNAKKEGKIKWDDQIKKIENSMIFEPSFLGMSNFFVYPKGYIAMDDILSKYGLGVNKGREVSSKFKIKITKPIYLDVTDEINDDEKEYFPKSWFGNRRSPILRGGNKPYGVSIEGSKGELTIRKPGDSKIMFDYVIELPINFKFEKNEREDGEEEEENNEKVTGKFFLRPLDNEINGGNDYLIDPAIVVEIIRKEEKN